MIEYKQGETVIIREECRDSDGLADPSTAKITVVDSTGQTVVAVTEDFTNTGSVVGKYHYNYTIAATAKTGVYKYEAIFTDASSLVAKDCGEFQVEEKL